MTTRRNLLFASLPLAVLKAQKPVIRAGVMDGILKLAGNPDSVARAKALGFDGLQVTLGKGNKLLGDASVQQRFVEESRRHAIPLVATYIDDLHINCLKQDRAAIDSAIQGVAITKALGSPILMLVFFGKCALETQAEMDAVVGPLKEVARAAEKAGIILGFENTLKAADALRVIDRVGSPAVKVYYDIGNATNLYKENPAEGLRLVGRDRLCQVHFKDKAMLGAGAVDVKSSVRALKEMNWSGYVVLETNLNLERDLGYVRGALAGA